MDRSLRTRACSVRDEVHAARRESPLPALSGFTNISGSFTLKDTTRPEGSNKLKFFIEADRSTESHERIETKIRGFMHYFAEVLHQGQGGKLITATV